MDLNLILSEAKEDIGDETELLPVLIMGSILMDSDMYWASELKSSHGWLSIALADASNGASGALWGAVAGPIGSVVVGINAAIIGSSAAYIIDQI